MGNNTYPQQNNALHNINIAMEIIGILDEANREEIIKIIDFLVLNEDSQHI